MHESYAKTKQEKRAHRAAILMRLGFDRNGNPIRNIQETLPEMKKISLPESTIRETEVLIVDRENIDYENAKRTVVEEKTALATQESSLNSLLLDDGLHQMSNGSELFEPRGAIG